MIVIDTSAVVSAGEQIAQQDLRSDSRATPIFMLRISSMARCFLRCVISSHEATRPRNADVRVDFAALTIVRYPHHPLADRMWELRHNVTANDAAFVVLSEALGAPLITCDARLASAVEQATDIELFA